MQQITRSIYLVDAGEVVTLEAEATKVGTFVSLVIDGEPIAPVSKTPLTFKYTVTVGSGGTHHGRMLVKIVFNRTTKLIFRFLALCLSYPTNVPAQIYR